MSANTDILKSPSLGVRLAYRIGLAGGEVLNLHTGVGFLTWEGNRYTGLGSLLTIDQVSVDAGVRANQFVLTLSAPAENMAELRTQSAGISLVDNDFEMFMLFTADGSGEVFEPQACLPLLLGKVSHSTNNAESIELTIYTAMTDATQIKGLARIWNDDHQTSFVNRNDRCFRFVDDAATKEITF